MDTKNWNDDFKKKDNIHKKCIRLVTNDFDSNFNQLLESSHELSIHKTSW